MTDVAVTTTNLAECLLDLSVKDLSEIAKDFADSGRETIVAADMRLWAMRFLHNPDGSRKPPSHTEIEG